LSIFEYIATDTTPADLDGSPSDSIPGGAYPVLLFDAGLAKQYDVTPPGRQTYGPNVNTFPEFDLVDWRNSGLQKKSGGGEKGWKVRPKGKGAMKAAPGSEVDTFPVLILRKELSESSREST
jgi:autophagy-related protein 2